MRRLRNLPALLYRTRGTGPLNTLLRWFLLCQPVTREQAAEIPGEIVEALSDCGLLRSEGPELVPGAMIQPFQNLLLATDPSLFVESGEHGDAVLAVNATTWLLHRFTIRRHWRSVFDFGTGCGVHALVAASHSDRVTGVDLNLRAIAYAKFNAAFNNIGNAEFLDGDAFTPVAGRKFDLIVANPPFFITPVSDHLYCENPLELDEFCARLAREAPVFLEEGGYLQMVCEWVQLRGQSWQERPSRWFEGSGCDAWAIKTYSQEPADYCLKRLKETTTADPDRDQARFEEWMRYYERKGVEAVHGGLVLLRRRSGGNWIRLDDLPFSVKHPFGDAVAEVVAARDYLDTLDGEAALGGARLRLSPRARLEQGMAPGENGWQGEALQLRLINGVPFTQDVEGLVAHFLVGFDGQHTVEELAQALAAKAGAPPDAALRECLGLARRLLETGFLLPA